MPNVNANILFLYTIRYVDKKQLHVSEVLIDMIELKELDAAGITNAIKESLQSLFLNVDDIRGQGYDGAAVMSGNFLLCFCFIRICLQLNIYTHACYLPCSSTGSVSGVATRFLEENAAAIYTHCQAHSLQLTLKDVLSSSSMLALSFSLLSDIYEIINSSPTRLIAYFKELCEHMNVNDGSNGNTRDGKIPRHCPTRFSCNVPAITNAIRNYKPIYNTISQLSHNKNLSLKAGLSEKLHSCFRSLQQFATILGLIICKLVFTLTDKSSKQLQSQTLTAQSANGIIHNLKTTSSDYRTKEEYWKDCWDEAIEIANSVDIEPQLPRRSKVNRRYDDGAENHQFEVEQYYRKMYYEVMDMLIASLDDRLNSEAIELLSSIEHLVVAACQEERTNRDCVVPQNIQSIYEKDFTFGKYNIDDLSGELMALRSDMELYCKRENIKGRITGIDQVIEFLSKADVDTSARYCLTKILLQLYLTPPLTSCSSERAFSAMRRIKTWSRSTMRQDRFRNLMLLHCHKELTLDLEVDDVIDLFISNCKNTSRALEFGAPKKKEKTILNYSWPPPIPN